ncbi:phospholipase A2 AP-PLA2-II-like [Asterias rubens]|uniref:phospholipase A2 AP-PLA2-II-like n=1 Tax=Asterias rubens TaxID=7604 RepID=UPI001455D918|nr:phospholipase A2 AP-PLA2-II-like [Asterias rubens]
MIGCLTDRSYLTSFTDYDGYGCWCGLGGKGTPRDGTDQCCKIHDKCYEAADGLCPFSYYKYIVLYISSTYDCDTPNARATCMKAEDYSSSRWWTKCSEAICECDRAAAECFAASAFDETYKNWDKDSC